MPTSRFELYCQQVQRYTNAQVLVLPAIRKGFESGQSSVEFADWYAKAFDVKARTPLSLWPDAQSAYAAKQSERNLGRANV